MVDVLWIVRRLAGHQGAARWTVPLITIATAKARAVVPHFMELKASPLIWRLAFGPGCS